MLKFTRLFQVLRSHQPTHRRTLLYTEIAIPWPGLLRGGPRFFPSSTLLIIIASSVDYYQPPLLGETFAESFNFFQPLSRVLVQSVL